MAINRVGHLTFRAKLVVNNLKDETTWKTKQLKRRKSFSIWRDANRGCYKRKPKIRRDTHSKFWLKSEHSQLRVVVASSDHLQINSFSSSYPCNGDFLATGVVSPSLGDSVTLSWFFFELFRNLIRKPLQKFAEVFSRWWERNFSGSN